MNGKIQLFLCLCGLVLTRSIKEEEYRAILKRIMSFRSSELGDGGQPKEKSHVSLTDTCSDEEKDYVYRSCNGACNNILHPYWGAAGAPYVRMVENAYDDEISVPRQLSISGKILPSPREISQSAMDTSNRHRNKHLTMMVMQWGQFLDHDIGSTPKTSHNITCCGNINQDSYFTDDVCFPIYIPDDDSYFDKSCMEFTRSKPFQGSGAERNQFDSITSFVDASMVYGSSQEKMQSLRTGFDGLLHTFSGDLLPQDDNPKACNVDKHPNNYCFLAGDARVNVVPGLSALHTIFVRFHNRIVKEIKLLSRFRPTDKISHTASLLKQLISSSTSNDWTDEELFQTARKTVSAVIQKITFKDYLPAVLGPEAFSYYKLDEDYKYNPNINPSLINGFITAAYRFGHSLIPKQMKIKNRNIPMHKLYFRTDAVINHFEDVIENLINKHSQERDTSVTVEMSNKLFKTRKGSLDIISLNIQRGRDHGLPPFNKYRTACGLDAFNTFDDFGRKCGNHLENLYESPDDVDLFVGGLCETSLDDAELGSTFACIIGQQFHNLRYGDRFFYENTDLDTGFTKEQQDLINKITMSKLLCDHGDIDEVQPDAFRADEEPGNEKISCREIHRI